MISKNIFPEIVKIDKEKKNKAVRESGCCFTSCGGMPVNQGYKESSGIKIKKSLKKIK